MGAASDRVVREIIFEIGTRIVERSPVGDADYWHWKPEAYVGGHFRANWQYGHNSAPHGEINGVTNDFVNRLNTKLSITDMAGMHYIVNNTPYSIRLENGWSHRQAPQGILSQVMQEVPAIVALAVNL